MLSGPDPPCKKPSLSEANRQGASAVVCSPNSFRAEPDRSGDARTGCHSVDPSEGQHEGATAGRRAPLPGPRARRQGHLPERHDVIAVRAMRSYLARLEP